MELLGASDTTYCGKCGWKGYRKRPNKRPEHLLGCPVTEEVEGAFIKTISELVW